MTRTDSESIGSQPRCSLPPCNTYVHHLSCRNPKKQALLWSFSEKGPVIKMARRYDRMISKQNIFCVVSSVGSIIWHLACSQTMEAANKLPLFRWMACMMGLQPGRAHTMPRKLQSGHSHDILIYIFSEYLGTFKSDKIPLTWKNTVIFEIDRR